MELLFYIYADYKIHSIVKCDCIENSKFCENWDLMIFLFVKYFSYFFNDCFKKFEKKDYVRGFLWSWHIYLAQRKLRFQYCAVNILTKYVQREEFKLNSNAQTRKMLVKLEVCQVRCRDIFHFMSTQVPISSKVENFIKNFVSGWWINIAVQKM